MKQLTYATEKARSGHVWMMYRRLPMTCQYSVASTYSSMLSWLNFSRSSMVGCGIAALHSGGVEDAYEIALVQRYSFSIVAHLNS